MDLLIYWMDLLWTPQQAGDQRHEEQHHEHHEQDLRDLGGAGGDAGEAEDGGDDCYDEKRKRPAEHDRDSLNERKQNSWSKVRAARGAVDSVRHAVPGTAHAESRA